MLVGRSASRKSTTPGNGFGMPAHRQQGKGIHQGVEKRIHQRKFIPAEHRHGREEVELSGIIRSQEIERMQKQRWFRGGPSTHANGAAKIGFRQPLAIAGEVQQVTGMERNLEKRHRCNRDFQERAGIRLPAIGR